MKITITVISIIVLISSILCLYFLKAGKIRKIDSQGKLISMMKADTGLLTPYKINIVEFEEEDGFDPSWIAKIRISKEDLIEFKKQLNAKNMSSTQISGNRLSESTEWWQPQNITVAKLYERNSLPIVVYIVISKDGDEEFIYIECITY